MKEPDAVPEGVPNITERWEREGMFRALLEAAPDALVIVGRDGRIVLVNGQTERLFGYSRVDLIGQPVEKLVPARHFAEHEGHRRNYFTEPRVREMGSGLELSALRKDGVEIPVEISLSPLETEHGILVSAAIRDVSERKEQYRRVQEASRLKSEFLANMSHELRTPLNAIIGFAELMHLEKVGSVSPDQKEYLGDILSSARHLLQLINDVLDLAKVESGTLEFHPEPIELARVVGEVGDVLRNIAAQKRVRIDVSVDPRVGEVVIDSSKLKQILYNYLSNALKFSNENGRVWVRVMAEGEDAFRIEVEDAGVGIRPDDLGRLFVKFQQLDASSARKYPGTGLGLALTKRIVEAQGGRVGVRSRYGSGSTFFAILPRRGATRSPGANAAKGKSRGEALDAGGPEER